jgi:nucleoside triphosphate pyrophosphatase
MLLGSRCGGPGLPYDLCPRPAYNTGRMLILASQSPRRVELLRNAGLAFEARPADVDERLRAGEAAFDYVQRLAREKALAVLATAAAGDLVLGADTTVVLDGESLGKPVDGDEARRMLARLSGRTHEVMTGVCLAWRGEQRVEFELGVEVTEVDFADLSEQQIAQYVATGEPMDKAGAYAIQGRASRWIPRIRGCYFNVVGLPVARVWAMLERATTNGPCLSR